jgi:hypothetical protein
MSCNQEREEMFNSLGCDQKDDILAIVARDYPEVFDKATQETGLNNSCEHPGVFATERPTEYCNRCNSDVPRELL